MNSQTCALVVTYNRVQLLMDCLDAIRNQSFPVSSIIIVDNFSNENTLISAKENGYLPEYDDDFIKNGGDLVSYVYDLSGQKITVYYKRLNKNIGGAGGFNAGVRFFYEKTACDKLWLMDDDCKPFDNTLKTLLQSYNSLETKYSNLGFICSKVLWTDMTLCKMANPSVKNTSCYEDFTIDNHVLEVESAAFVSIMFSRDVVDAVGLPIKEYFIWSDDLEYTYRINKNFRSFVSLDSVVIHQTAFNLSASANIDSSNLFKYKFGIRNKISWLRANKGKLRALYYSCKFLKIIFVSNLCMFDKFMLLKSLINGWFFSPKIELVSKK